MKAVNIIREQHRLATLQQLAAKPHRTRIVHLDNIRSIGIILSCLTDEEQVTVSQFMHHMTDRGIMVRKIELPANAETLLDKQGFPKQEFTQLFTSYHYDLLINATPTDDLFGLYLSLSSSSNLRVAYQDTTFPTQDITLSTYDLLIRGNGPLILSQYLTDLLNILLQIRKNRTKRN